MAIMNQKEIDVMKDLYVDTDIPSDSLIKQKDKLEVFTDKLNRSLSSKFKDEEVATELLRIRKKGELPKIRN
ncbi:MAG: hypothetical protein KAS23_15405 [Anaerohalosphaera sp.]|nr:hypothetical protein [Anaerohalosphaera sp.]